VKTEKAEKINPDDLAVASHERGYLLLLLNPATGETWTQWQEQHYYSCGDMVVLRRYGTGPSRCECEGCLRGDDPADWEDQSSIVDSVEDLVADYYSSH